MNFRFLFLEYRKVSSNHGVKFMNKKLISLIALGLSLVGCGNSHRDVVDLNLIYITTDSAPVADSSYASERDMVQSSHSVSHSLRELAAIERASRPDLRLPKTYNARQLHMTERMSVSWTGPVEPILRKVANKSHYKLIVIGVKPVIPVLVSINKKDEPLANIFHDIRYQIVEKAQVLVYPKANVIELRYFKN